MMLPPPSGNWYYRLALKNSYGFWEWYGPATSKVTDIDHQLLDPRLGGLRVDRICVFEAASPERLEHVIRMANDRIGRRQETEDASALPPPPNVSPRPQKPVPERLDWENRTPGDHDEPYVFRMPTNTKELSAWVAFAQKVQQQCGARRNKCVKEGVTE